MPLEKKKDRDLESRNLDVNILKIHTKRRSEKRREREAKGSTNPPSQNSCAAHRTIYVSRFRVENDSPKMTKAQGKKGMRARETFFLSSRRGRAILIDSSLDNGRLLRRL